VSGTVVAASLVCTDEKDTYATHHANLGAGGLQHVQTLANLEEITTARRQHGMLVHVAANDEYYRLLNDLQTWQKFVNAENASVDQVATAVGEYTASPLDSKIFLEEGASVTIDCSLLSKGKEYTLVALDSNTSVIFQGCQLFSINNTDGLAEFNFSNPFETLQIIFDGGRFINTMAFFIQNQVLENANVLIGEAGALGDAAGTRLGDQYIVTAIFDVTTLTVDGGDDETTRVYPNDIITRKSSTEWDVRRGAPVIQTIPVNTTGNSIQGFFPHIFVSTTEMEANGTTPKGRFMFFVEQLTDGMNIRVHNTGAMPVHLTDNPAGSSLLKFQKKDGTFTDPNEVDFVEVGAGESFTYVYEAATETFRISG